MIRCPCCGYLTIDDSASVITDICEVCFWQYDKSEDIMGFFDPFLNTETQQRRNIIVLDINNAIKHCYAEFLDTLAHEVWHAVQSDMGLIMVDSHNKITYKPNYDIIEAGATNMGYTFYNKYALKNGLPIKRYKEIP